MTPLEKTLKRQLSIDGVEYVITLSPESLKITVKNHRLGVELPWKELISGESALAVALNASLGKFAVGSAPVAVQATPNEVPAVQGQGGSTRGGDASPASAQAMPVSKSKARAKLSTSEKNKSKSQKQKGGG